MGKISSRAAPIDLARSTRGDVVELTEQERLSWQQSWRRTYARAVKAKTGKWVYSRYDWHAFSWNFTVADHGPRALALYLAEAIQPLIAVPESAKSVGFRIANTPPIDFSTCMTDMEIFPPDLRWTIAFTHEYPDIGPFFCRREWCTKYDGA